MYPEFDPLAFGHAYPPAPPGYEECVAKPASSRVGFVISPLAMAMFAWDEDDD